MTPAKQAAAEIRALLSERSAKTTCMATEQMELIIQRAIFQEVAPLQAVIDARGKEITRLLSNQRPYVEWIMKADHQLNCSWHYPDGKCQCGLSLLRDELRKQVGGD